MYKTKFFVKLLLVSIFLSSVMFIPNSAYHAASADAADPPVGDSYEPDNSSGEATLIESEISQPHSIVPVGDEDWVTFTLPSESQIFLSTYGGSEGGDTELWLYDSELTLVEYNDDNSITDYSTIDRFCGEDALPAGTYYAKVNEWGNNAEIASYNILLYNVTSCPQFNFLPLVVKPDVALSNGDFELGHANWTESSSSANDLITDSMPITPHSGTWLAKFGENNLETDQLSQVVTIPVGLTDLHYWYWIPPTSEQSMGTDFFYVRIDGFAVQITHLYIGAFTPYWVEGVLDLSAYAGSSVTLMFEVTTNGMYPSTLYLDDVSFESP